MSSQCLLLFWLSLTSRLVYFHLVLFQFLVAIRKQKRGKAGANLAIPGFCVPSCNRRYCTDIQPANNDEDAACMRHTTDGEFPNSDPVVNFNTLSQQPIPLSSYFTAQNNLTTFLDVLCGISEKSSA